VERNIVKIITEECLGLKRSEELLVVCDDELCELAYDFYKGSQRLGIEAAYLLIKSRKMHGQEPPQAVAESLKKADAAVLFTSMSLSHTKARKAACKKYKTRIASLPGITSKILKRSIDINYKNLQKKAKELSQILTKAKKIRVRTKKGTDLIIPVRGRPGFPDDGIYTKPGAFGNLPAGEACIGPLEGTTNGRLIVDASAPFLGKLKKPIKIVIKNGYAQNIPTKQMKPLVKRYGKAVLNVAELGIGLNPKARVTGNTLEDEKTLGTAHIAFGNNKSFGGRVACPVHLDFVFLKPEITYE